jgi:hypothetical protein
MEKPPLMFNFVLAVTPFTNRSTTKGRNIAIKDGQVPLSLEDKQDVHRLMN